MVNKSLYIIQLHGHKAKIEDFTVPRHFPKLKKKKSQRVIIVETKLLKTFIVINLMAIIWKHLNF